MIAEKTLKTLEFDKVLERLAAHASFSLSKELVAGTQPAVELDEVRTLQQQVREAGRALESRADLSLGGAHDIRSQVSRTMLGGSLDPMQLLDVQSTLACADRVRGSLARLDAEEYPWLAGQRMRMGNFREIITLITQSINDQGDVMDGASQALGRIRGDLRVAHQRLIDRLQSILSSQTYRTAIQEPIITTRNGRYVIPVRADARGVIRGLVHDHSSSGATLYIEPLQTTDLNNRWRELQLEEQAEIERILQQIADRIALQGPSIQQTVNALADLDVAMAKARYGLSVRGIVADLSEGRSLSLISARHPLLTGEVVPISVRLGDDFRELLITGPNTGGKTVALKTVGLLTLMTQCGIPIPAAPGSRAAVFDGIYADIGDEQSIEQSLSTFSSHLTNIIRILAEMPDNSLLLLDELGAGTDPAEGSALARSLLTYLLERSALVMATTHYSELKAFAYATNGVENASVEFDVETLAPTYRLSIGLPGRSNALAIASRLGLPRAIIEGSNAFLNSDEQRVETLLSDIQRERDQAAELFAGAAAAQRAAADLRRRLDREVQAVLRERDAILRAARAEASTSVEDLRRELDRMEAELRLNGAAPQLALAGMRERLDAAVAQQQVLLPQAPPVVAREPVAVAALLAPADRPLGVGDKVLIVRTGQEGTVTTAQQGRNEIEVQVGPFKTRVKRDTVRLVGLAEDQVVEAPMYGGTRFQRAETPAPSIDFDLRGWRVDEVIHELERYINDAYMSNLPFVRIIHGKGTGALRQVVREELATNPLISGFRPAEAREGGDGVTVATLAT